MPTQERVTSERDGEIMKSCSSSKQPIEKSDSSVDGKKVSQSEEPETEKYGFNTRDNFSRT